MSVNLGTVHVSLEMRLQKLKDGIRDAKVELGSLETDTKRRAERIGQTLTGLGRSMSLGITAPLVLMGKSAIDSAIRMDQLTRSLTSLTGDSKETEKQLVRLREAARMPGLGFRELIEGSVRLQSAGLNAKQAEAALRGFGNALALAGGSKEDLKEVGVQLAQIASSGKLQGDELRIIAERVPQLRAVLKEAFGTASSEEISKFGLSMDELFGVMTEGLNKLPQASDSARNKLDNFNEAIRDLKDAVGGAFLPALTDGLKLMSERVEEATKWFKELDPAAQQGLGKLAIGGAIMGPALIGLGALATAFTKLANNPFFKWLVRTGKSGGGGIFGPGLVGGLLPESTGARQQRLFGPDLTPEEQQLGRLGSQRREIEEQRGLFPFGVPRMKDQFTANLKPGTFPRWKPLPPMPQGFMRDPLTGAVVPVPRMGVVPTKRDYEAEAKAKKAAEDARKKAEAEAKRRAEFGAEYEKTADIEVLRQTPGRQFTTLLREAEKEYRDSVAKGARRVDAEKVLVAKVKAIWTEHDKWDAERLERVRTREAAINEERLNWALKGVQLAKVAGGEIGLIPTLRGGVPRIGGRPTGGPDVTMPAAWRAFGRSLKMPPPGTLSAGQAAQGQEFLAGIEQLAGMEQQRKLDALKPGFKKPMGDLFGADLAQELKPKITPFTFELGKHLGDNLAMEMGREFSIAFDKIFGTKNPLARALSNTLGRLVDDLMYSIAQRALGSRLILSLFGGGGGAGGLALGAAGAGIGAAGAGAIGSAELMGGAAVAGKAAGITFASAFTVVAGAYIASRALNAIFPGSPEGKAHHKRRFAMDLPYKSAFAAQATGHGAWNPNINFYGAQFNNDQDPQRAATRMAWHLDQKMRSRPGS